MAENSLLFILDIELALGVNYVSQKGIKLEFAFRIGRT